MGLIEKFLNFYEIRARFTGKYFSKIDQHLDFFRDSKSFDVVNHSITPIREKIYEVEMPESVLEELAKLRMLNYDDLGLPGEPSNSRRMFLTLLSQKEEEGRLRAQYPAVQKAYEHYSMLLSMCKSKEDY